MMNKAFFLIAVNAPTIPTHIPPFLMRSVLVLSNARKAILETESLVSVVVQSGDGPRERAARVSTLLLQYANEYSDKIRDVLHEHARLASSMPTAEQSIASAVGSELGLVALVTANMRMRGDILSGIGAHPLDMWTPAEGLAFHCLAEAFKGQSHMLDWLSCNVSGSQPIKAEGA